MSSKVELVTVNTPLNSTSFQQQINSNFEAIEESLNKQLQREPQEDVNNAMQQELDMNSYRVINLAEPINPADAATKHYVDTTVKPELEANKVVVSDSNGDIVSSSITTTELNTLSGISGNIQEQIDSKQDTISDLAEIRAGAAAGATALQATDLKTINGESVVGEGDIVTQNLIAGNNITISDNVISAPVMTGASSLAAGTSGTVPQPAIGDQVKFLRGDGTWVDLGVVLVYKGSVATYADLPSSGNTAGDVWNVVADGKNYAWTGTAWDDFGGAVTVALSACTDVTITNPSNGEALIYNSTSQKWENGSGGFLYNTSSSTNALGVGTGSNANSSSTAVGAGANANGGTGSNTAIGYGASATEGSGVAIGTTAVAKNGGVAIGSDAKNSYGNVSTVIGSSAQASSGDSVVVGYNATASGGVTVGSRAKSQSTGIAIGKEAQANGEGRIQLGAFGTNNTDYTMNVALKYDLNVQLLDNTGEIPVARYKAFTGTDGVNAGTKGCVPAPTASDADKFLKSDGTWASAGGGGGSVTLNDIAAAGNNISFVDNSTNYDIAGSCSVDSNYIATNFGANDYIVSGAEIPQSATTWEVGVKVHTANSLSGNAFIFSGLVDETISAGLYQSNATLNAGNGSWFGGAVYEEDIAAANKDMWYKLIFDGTKYSLQTSLDGVYYSEAAYLTNSTKILSTKVKFGVTESGALVQSIDLKETYIKVNGVETWRAVVAGKTTINADVLLSDIAEAGTGINIQNQSVQTHYTVVGSPTIVDYIANDFNSSNYITGLSFDDGQDFELVTKIKNNSSYSSFCHLIGTTSSNSNGLYIGIDGSNCWHLNVGNGSSWAGGGDTVIPVSANVDYWVKCTRVGNVVSLETSTDNQTWTQVASITTSYSTTGTLSIGANSSGGDSAGLTSIDLKETYIKVNGDYLWRAVVPTGKATISSNIVLSDIAEAGDNITLTTGTVTDNISSTDKIGSPTISREGLFTPTDTAYLQITSASVGQSVGTIFSGGYAWELTVKFKTPASYINASWLWVYGGSIPYPNAGGILTDQGKIGFNFKVYNWENYTGTTTLDTDTDYYAKFIYDIINYKYIVQISKDGTNWTTEIESTSGGALYGGTSQYLYISNVSSSTPAVQYDLNGLSLTSAYNSTDWKAYTYVASKTVIAAPNALTNLATGSHALSVGSISQANTGWAITTFGDSCRPSGSAITLVGYKAEAYNGPTAAVVVGCDSKAKATGSIHLGCYGENNVAGTFTVSLSTDGNWQNTHNYTMCDADGYIPGARMSIQAAGAPTTSTAGTVGQFYVDTTNKDAYICVDDTSSTYTWKKITP